MSRMITAIVGFGSVGVIYALVSEVTEFAGLRVEHILSTGDISAQVLQLDKGEMVHGEILEQVRRHKVPIIKTLQEQDSPLAQSIRKRIGQLNEADIDRTGGNLAALNTQVQRGTDQWEQEIHRLTALLDGGDIEQQKSAARILLAQEGASSVSSLLAKTGNSDDPEFYCLAALQNISQTGDESEAIIRELLRNPSQVMHSGCRSVLEMQLEPTNHPPAPI